MLLRGPTACDTDIMESGRKREWMGLCSRIAVIYYTWRLPLSSTGQKKCKEDHQILTREGTPCGYCGTISRVKTVSGYESKQEGEGVNAAAPQGKCFLSRWCSGSHLLSKPLFSRSTRGHWFKWHPKWTPCAFLLFPHSPVYFFKCVRASLTSRGATPAMKIS